MRTRSIGSKGSYHFIINLDKTTLELKPLFHFCDKMDDFAQSREPDDLFSDDIESIEYEMLDSTTISQPPPQSDIPPSVPQNQQRHGVPGINNNHRGGRRGGHNTPATNPRSEPPALAKPTSPAQEDTTATSPAATEPSNVQETPRIASVRGDRSATGPAKPTKKTEAELSELMKAMQLKNAAKTEAHARAEKDQASFLHREQQAAAKRVEERKAIREQDMERAKNRERKIRAQGGREWDSEKVESDIVDRSRGESSMYSRGAHGGVARGNGRGGLTSSRYGSEEGSEEAVYSSRGSRGRSRGQFDYQGGRGNGSQSGRGRRGGRGGLFNGSNASQSSAPSTGESDFPALPTPTRKNFASDAPQTKSQEISATSPTTSEGGWVEQKTDRKENIITSQGLGEGDWVEQKTESKEITTTSPGRGEGDWAEQMATPIEPSAMATPVEQVKW